MLSPVSAPLLYFCPCYLQKPEIKKRKMDFKQKVHPVAERDR